MQGVPGRTALVTGAEPRPADSPSQARCACSATGAEKAAKAVPPHVAAPLPLPPRPTESAGPAPICRPGDPGPIPRSYG
ncbi:hypothetical protein QFZ74_005067 [Streptomyces sp. V3I7]|nr:hypothetical protein [Streptomyces sp. V3I7]